MKFVRVLVIAALLAASLAVLHAPAPASAANGMLYTCSNLNDPAFDATYSIRIIGPAQFKAGEIITLIAQNAVIPVQSDAFFKIAALQVDQIVLAFNGSPVASVSYPGTLVYTVPSDILLTDVEWYLTSQRVADWRVSCSSPGCETLVGPSKESVVGAFVADALLYWSPGKLVQPLATIKAGNTAWVLGVDKSGQYYKIVWVCQYLWVPISTMGPNYDKVWNGKALPTGVVS